MKIHLNPHFNSRFNPRHLLSLGFAALCSIGLVATQVGTVAHAQPLAANPTPPRDAKKVAYSLKSGSIKLDVDNDERLAPQQFKDFDVVATFINPSLPRWDYGFFLRRQPAQGGLLFTVDQTGNAALGLVKDDYAPVKDPVTARGLRKNVGERNEIALYVRGGTIMAFINKVYVDTWTVTEFLDAGEVALIGFSPDDNATGEIKFTNYLVRTPPNAAPGAAVAPTATPAATSGSESGNPSGNDKVPTGNIEVVLTGKVSYVPWGRPIGMVKPGEGCNSFNDGSPVQQAQISVRVTNISNKVMEKWGAIIVKPGNVPAFWCYYAYNELDGRLEPGQSANVTFAAFVENGESVEGLVIFDEALGISNKLSLQ